MPEGVKPTPEIIAKARNFLDEYGFDKESVAHTFGWTIPELDRYIAGEGVVDDEAATVVQQPLVTAPRESSPAASSGQPQRASRSRQFPVRATMPARSGRRTPRIASGKSSPTSPPRQEPTKPQRSARAHGDFAIVAAEDRLPRMIIPSEALNALGWVSGTEVMWIKKAGGFNLRTYGSMEHGPRSWMQGHEGGGLVSRKDGGLYLAFEDAPRSIRWRVGTRLTWRICTNGTMRIDLARR